MSEMLGNQYFMARNYVSAEKELEPVYQKESENKAIRRKLIICYTQTRKFEKALAVFHSLVHDDIQFITLADSVLDDCPCAELLNEFDRTHDVNDEYEYSLSHGMLWLYCDVAKSLEYLKKAFQLSSINEKLKDSIKAIDIFHKSIHIN